MLGCSLCSLCGRLAIPRPHPHICRNCLLFPGNFGASSFESRTHCLWASPVALYLATLCTCTFFVRHELPNNPLNYITLALVCRAYSQMATVFRPTKTREVLAALVLLPTLATRVDDPEDKIDDDSQQQHDGEHGGAEPIVKTGLASLPYTLGSPVVCR